MDDTKSSPLYTVIYSDNTAYQGGFSAQDTGWLGIANKPIKRIFFLLPDLNHICLEGYEKYNRVTEATTDLNGDLKGKCVIRYVYLMGLKNEIVTSYRITMYEGKNGKDKFRQGDITRREFKLGTEWYGGATSGWK